MFKYSSIAPIAAMKMSKDKDEKLTSSIAVSPSFRDELKSKAQKHACMHNCPKCGRPMRDVSTKERPRLYMHARRNKKCRVMAIQLTHDGEVWRIFYHDEPIGLGFDYTK
jgi:hypothetical protein